MEKELVLRAQSGDSAALAEIYKSMYKRVYYLALRMTNSSEDAEDTAQETFLSAFGSLKKLQKPEAFESWLMQICANRCRNLMRKESHTVDLTEDEEGNTVLDELADSDESLIPETVLQNEAQRRLIMETIRTLPEQQRECVLLYYYSGLDIRKIAGELGCSEGTVKSRLNYARQKIKDSILAIEKRDGIRLHSFAPLALLFATDLEAVTASLTIPVLGGATGVAFGSAAAGTAATSAKVAAGAAFKTKIIASVAAAAVVVGGGTAIYHAAQAREPSPYVEFVDDGMEHNMHVLLDVPADEPILKESLAQIDSIFFIEDGMNLFSDEWVVGWTTEYGEYSETEPTYGSPLYSVEKIAPAEGTVPVEDLSDLRYFGTGALHIGILDAKTRVDSAVLSALLPDCTVREQPNGGVKIPFMGSVYWDDSGEVRINSQVALDRLESCLLIREPKYVEFADANMEHNIHVLLEIPADTPISSYEMEQLRQVEFSDGKMSLFLTGFNGGVWVPYQLSEQTRMPEKFDDLKLLSGKHLLISVPNKGSVDEQAILSVRPDVEFHYYSAED